MLIRFPSAKDCYRIQIDKIPVYITEDHHQNMKYWFRLEDTDLLHVDAHHDMDDNVQENLANLNIANFICPAFHYRKISSIYWLNPHSDKRLQYNGSRDSAQKPIKLGTKLEKKYTENFMKWTRKAVHKGSVIDYNQLMLSPGKDFIN